ncbi:hypothetical protein CEXT_375971 [Caerostris extrusa]|uniref:Uncharacterized protein n=1 Tax=Caerostris extrusa TaxID=172846 RepID=A0AAV4TMD0_CAEEX|nr:hypothetical protein CEXT_375971 [Caerostris extrusa]
MPRSFWSQHREFEAGSMINDQFEANEPVREAERDHTSIHLTGNENKNKKINECIACFSIQFLVDVSVRQDYFSFAL